jgi:steroid 5-alpha reductase family enzyme
MENIALKRIVALVVIVSIGAGLSYAGGDGGAAYAGIPVFVICGALAFIVNWVAFIPANMAQTEKYYDLVGSLTYLSIIGTAVILSPDLSTRGQIAAMMVAVWALRLGTFLFRRISQDGHDDRFDDIKINPLRFFIALTLNSLC